MKKYLLVLAIILLAACQRDLPPEPGSPEAMGRAPGYEGFSSPGVRSFALERGVLHVSHRRSARRRECPTIRHLYQQDF